VGIDHLHGEHRCRQQNAADQPDERRLHPPHGAAFYCIPPRRGGRRVLAKGRDATCNA
jgi:hypothetical protein